MYDARPTRDDAVHSQRLIQPAAALALALAAALTAASDAATPIAAAAHADVALAAALVASAHVLCNRHDELDDQRGPGNLRLRIIEWYKDDPAFIGLDPRDWCKRVTSNDAPQNGSGKTYLYKFCFEYTPRHLSGLCVRSDAH